jgi:5-methylcytosine-specific restriction endonuclease McrA
LDDTWRLVHHRQHHDRYDHQHHIDLDHGHNVEENLTLLCFG